MQIDLLDVGLRTHEILENALQFQLTGHDDYGSGTTLATTGANVAGTRELLTVLRPLLAPRYTGLPAVYTWLDRLQTLIGQAKGPNRAWLSVSALSLKLTTTHYPGNSSNPVRLPLRAGLPAAGQADADAGVPRRQPRPGPGRR